MRKHIFPMLLAVALVNAVCFGQTEAPSIQDQIRSIPPNSPVEIRLEGSKLRGWISEVSDTGFILTQEHRHQLEKTPIQFQQVQSVKSVKSVKPSHTTRNILIGVGIGLGVAAGLLAAAAASGPMMW